MIKTLSLAGAAFAMTAAALVPATPAAAPVISVLTGVAPLAARR